MVVAGDGGFEGGWEGSPGDELEELVDRWFSVYCPACNSRYGHSATHCPSDGTELRHLSVVTGGSVTGGEEITGQSLTTGDFLPRCPECGNTCGLGETSCPHDGAPLTLPWLEEPAAESDLPRVIGEKWRLERRVSSSTTFGIFYRGVHDILGMDVGVKILKPRFTATERGRRLFHNEAMRLSLLDHPNIVKVFDYGEDDGAPFLIMEYLKGKPLFHYMSDGELAIEDRIDVICQVAQALTHAHSDGDNREPLVHLDLKPEHIFLEKVGDRWHVKVIDFGIAEIVAPGPSDGSGDGKPGRVAGTIPYMAPERFDGAVDPRCDLYSLGIILYELVAGRRPFDASEPEVLEELHKTLVPTPPSRHGLPRPTETDRKLDAIILRTLEKKPEDRPESAKALLKSLESWKELRAREREERQRSTGEKLLRIAQRASLGVILAVVVVGGMLYWAPLEEVVIESGRIILGTDPGHELEVNVENAWIGGYRNAYLDVLTPATTVSIPLHAPPAFVPDPDSNELRFALPGKEALEAIEIDLVSGSFSAELRLEGALGRSKSSEPIGLVVDYTPPDIETIDGGKLREDGRTLILPRSTEKSLVRVTSNEELDAERSRLGGEKGQRPDAGENRERLLLFETQPGRDVHELTLYDSAGNHESWRVELVDQPSIELVDESSILTSEKRYEFSLGEHVRIRGDFAHGRITVDGEKHPFSAGDASPSIRVEFDENKDSERKTIVISVDPLLISQPAATETIDIDYRSGELELEFDSASRKYRILDQRGQTATDTRISKCVVIHKGSGTKVPFQHDGGELNPPPDLGLRGWYTAHLTAIDDYGRGGFIKQDFLFPAAPVIKEVRPNADLGTLEKRLHPSDCSCTGPKPRELTLTVDVDYPYRERLEWELTTGDGDTIDDGFFKDLESAEQGSVTLVPVRIDRLLERIDGPVNTLQFSVQDRGAREDLSTSTELPIYFDNPKIHVSHAGEVTEEVNTVKVDVDTRSGVSAVRFRVGNGEWELRRASNGAFEYTFVVERVGRTRLGVIVDFEDGRSHEVQRVDYWRAPVAGQRYAFTIPGLKNHLVLFYGTYRDREFWYTKATKERVDYDKAEKRRDELEKTLREVFPSDDVRVRLPDLNHSKAIQAYDQMPNGREWLSREGRDDLSENHAPGVWIREGYTPIEEPHLVRRLPGNGESGHSLPHRYIIPYKRNGALSPANARPDESEERGE